MISLGPNGLETQKMSKRTHSRSCGSFTRWDCTFSDRSRIASFEVSVDAGIFSRPVVSSQPREATLNSFEKALRNIL
jgi:hypothetical protein